MSGLISLREAARERAYGPVLETKKQIPSTKQQTNDKFQLPKQTCFEFAFYDLFVICCLRFAI